MYAFAEWLEDLLDGLEVAKASLLGLSQGGWTALRFATCCPERVEKLVLLAPGGVAPARASFILRAVVLSMCGRRGAEALNRIVFNGQPIHPEAAHFMDVIMTHFRARIGAQPMFTDDELRRLTMPVLLIGGARDAILPSEKTAARLSSLLPHLEAHLLPEAGHALIDQAPQPWRSWLHEKCSCHGSEDQGASVSFCYWRPCAPSFRMGLERLSRVTGAPGSLSAEC